MAVHELDPISRIEGHLGAKLTVTSGSVTDVQVHGNLWRGFENFLIGREPNDAITFTQRICGVCPVPHGNTSNHAVEAAIGYAPLGFQTPDMAANGGTGVPVKAIHVRNLILGSEFIMSSLTHFYHLVAPSYVQGPAVPPWTPYFADGYYHAALQSTGKGTSHNTINTVSPGAGTGPYGGALAANGVLPLDSKGFSADVWSAVIKQYVKALRIRRLTFEAGAMFAGRMPMTSSYVAGGVTTYKNENLTTKKTKFRALMVEIGDFVIKEYIPLVLALGLLYPEFDNKFNGGFGWGAGCCNYLSWGAFPKAATAMDATGVSGNNFPRGWVKNWGGTFGTAETSGTIVAADIQTELVEHTKYSRYQQNATYGYDATTGASFPYTASRTVPQRNKSGAYTYLKAPRWSGKPMEVGPLARLVVMGEYEYNTTLLTSGTLVSTVANMYAKTYNFGAGVETGLDPKMVEADLAVALVRAGLARAKFTGLDVSGVVTGAPAGAGLVWEVVSGSAFTAGAGTAASPHQIGINHADLSGAEIGVVYGLASTIILGAVTTWIVDMKLGASTMDRIRARALESAVMMAWILGLPSKAGAAVAWPNTGWIDALSSSGESYNYVATPATQSTGIGASEAPRGALMHICTINNKLIERYQCIVPTTWNASPRDASGNKGPMEQAMVATTTGGVNDPATRPVRYSAAGGVLYKLGAGSTSTATQGGVEALRIAQSFDPCIACAVH